MISIYPESKIYIMCPPNHSTGGTELLHQLASKLRHFKFNCLMYYMPQSSINPVHENFNQYNIKYVTTIEDDTKNILIMPEIYIAFFRGNKIKNTRKVIWWLSVDDYLHRLNSIIKSKKSKPFFGLKKFVGRYQFPDLKFFTKAKIFHLVQSQYAWTFLTDNNIKVKGYLSDFLNKEFLQRETTHSRLDYVLYNPSKGYEFTKQLIALAPNIQWIPLQNMNPHQVAEMLSKGKVYIDFGHHPGKDRLPREAAIMGCCVITGRRGSANFEKDVSIPDEYKFDERTVDPILIINKVKKCLDNYSCESGNFSSYIKIIKEEEQKFEEDLLKIFKMTS